MGPSPDKGEHMTKYVVITPARDEAEHLEKTIRSVVSQTIQPAQWIIVNDGSRDETGHIIDRFAREYSWITAWHRPNRGYREAGGGVVKTFYDGYEQIHVADWDLLVKLDADLSFDPSYFEHCIMEFDRNPRLGIGGGAIYHENDGRLELEKNPTFHVRGATKMYRRACWDALGGLVQAPGWDTVDEVKANMLGWTTRSFLDLPVSHSRFTGAAEGAWRDCIKNGRANYVTGYHPLFMIAKCLRRLVTRPYLLGSIGLMWGFVSSYWNGTPRIEDPKLLRYTRDQQLKRLFLQESIWK
jgi:poly-beta-1,6-N-acetyl-D-glucosamine synthase